MGIEDLFIYDIVVLNPGTTQNRYNADVKDWTDPAESPERAWITQTSRQEDSSGREAETTGWRLFLSTDSAITAQSRIRWNATDFEVVGVPFPARSPKSGHEHVEADMRLVEG